eukprot:Platyproteum_vivax@DN9243_c0_g1_i1.p1
MRFTLVLLFMAVIGVIGILRDDDPNQELRERLSFMHDPQIRTLTERLFLGEKKTKEGNPYRVVPRPNLFPALAKNRSKKKEEPQNPHRFTPQEQRRLGINHPAVINPYPKLPPIHKKSKLGYGRPTLPKTRFTYRQ